MIDYKCSHCAARGVKLWRHYNGCSEFFCVDCALNRESCLVTIRDPKLVKADGKHLDGRGFRSDQLNGLMPCVPDSEFQEIWGYTSVPWDRCQWWYALPLRDWRKIRAARRQRRRSIQNASGAKRERSILEMEDKNK